MLATQLGPLQLECCVYNASGPRTGSAEALAKIGGSRAGAVLSKSATLVKQDGNPMPRAIAAVDLGAASAAGSMNSEGLPNYGIDYYLSADAVASAPASKPYIVSLSGLKLADNLEMGARCSPTASRRSSSTSRARTSRASRPSRTISSRWSRSSRR